VYIKRQAASEDIHCKGKKIERAIKLGREGGEIVY
jgi:hypothetical protein